MPMSWQAPLSRCTVAHVYLLARRTWLPGSEPALASAWPTSPTTSHATSDAGSPDQTGPDSITHKPDGKAAELQQAYFNGLYVGAAPESGAGAFEDAEGSSAELSSSVCWAPLPMQTTTTTTTTTTRGDQAPPAAGADVHGGKQADKGPAARHAGMSQPDRSMLRTTDVTRALPAASTSQLVAGASARALRLHDMTAMLQTGAGMSTAMQTQSTAAMKVAAGDTLAGLAAQLVTMRADDDTEDAPAVQRCGLFKTPSLQRLYQSRLVRKLSSKCAPDHCFLCLGRRSWYTSACHSAQMGTT